MLRIINLACLIILLASCSQEEDQSATAPQCTYQSQVAKDLKLSTLPHQLQIPLQQEKLLPLLWTEPQQGECFLQKNGDIKLYKVSTNDSRRDSPEFLNLKSAPQKNIENWLHNEQSIGTSLMGLTTFRFYEAPKERIVDVSILLRDTARPWHLWHEYAHYIIGKNRVDSPSENLVVHNENDVQNAFKKLLASQNSQEEFFKNLQLFSLLQKDFIQKKFIDEMVIELTLQELSQQAQDLLPVYREDFLTSQQVVFFFYENYILYLETSLSELRQLEDTLPEEWKAPVTSTLNDLRQQKQILKNILFKKSTPLQEPDSF